MDFQRWAEVLIPVVGAVWYLGRQLGEIKTSISGIVETVHELKDEKLPARMATVETHLGLR